MQTLIWTISQNTDHYRKLTKQRYLKQWIWIRSRWHDVWLLIFIEILVLIQGFQKQRTKIFHKVFFLQDLWGPHLVDWSLKNKPISNCTLSFESPYMGSIFIQYHYHGQGMDAVLDKLWPVTWITSRTTTIWRAASAPVVVYVFCMICALYVPYGAAAGAS